jgi:O-methyltransferase involved in polyketide biosynthesis
MKPKFSINKGPIQETLLLSLWGGAVEAQKDKPRLIDEKPVEIIDRLDHDFSAITGKMSSMSQHGWIKRSIRIDKMV